MQNETKNRFFLVVVDETEERLAVLQQGATVEQVRQGGRLVRLFGEVNPSLFIFEPGGDGAESPAKSGTQNGRR